MTDNETNAVVADNNTPEIVYDEETKTITGLNNQDKIIVTIVIRKDAGGKYSLVSQKVERVGDNGNTIIIENLLGTPSSSTSGGGNDQSSDIYILPKANKRKIRQIYNKTLSRKKRSA